MFNSSTYRRYRNLSSCTIVLLAVVFGSCGSNKLSTTDVITQGFADLRSTASSVVSDPLRQDKFLQATQQLESGLRSFEAYSLGAIEKFQLSFKDYDVSRETLVNLSAEFHQEQQKARAAFLDAHLAMAASVTADEWKPLAKVENRMLEDLRAAAARSTQ